MQRKVGDTVEVFRRRLDLLSDVCIGFRGKIIRIDNTQTPKEEREGRFEEKYVVQTDDWGPLMKSETGRKVYSWKPGNHSTFYSDELK